MARENTKLETAIEWLLYLFIFLLPWQTQWIFVDSSIQWQKMSLYSFDIVLVILFGITIILKFEYRNSKKIRNSKFKIINKLFFTRYSLLIILALASTLWSSNQTLALYWSARLILAICLIWLLKNIKFSFKKIAWILVLTIFIQALIGIGQFVTQDDLLTSKWLGSSVQQAATLGTAVIETETGRWLRAHGTQTNPNILGGLLVIGIILTFFLFKKLQVTGLPRVSATILRGYRLRVTNIFLISNCLLLATALFFTFSRSAWLALVLIFLFWLIKQSKKSFRQDSKLIIPAVLLIIILSTIYAPLVKTRFSNTARLEQKSTQQRINQLQEFQNLVKTNPILGVGLGNYTTALQKKIPQLAWYDIQPVHNLYLLVITELGLVGFVLFSIIIWQVLRIKNQESRIKENKTILTILSVILIISFFDHYWWTYTSGVYLFWLIIALTQANQLPAHEQ